jgi:hypothetical protein
MQKLPKEERRWQIMIFQTRLWLADQMLDAKLLADMYQRRKV